jgi:hypothetical protein
MPLIASIKTWIDNEILTATDLNAALAEIRTTTNSWAAWRDQAQTFTAAQTFAALATYQAGATVAGGVTVSSGGVAVTGASSFAGTVTVSAGGIAVTGNSSVVGTMTATAFVGVGSGLTGITVAASGVSAGTFGAGNYAFPGNITSTSGEVLTRTLRVTRTTQGAAGGTANFANGNHHRITMTGNGTITLSGGAVGGIYTVEVVQDAVGGRTVAWSGATWAGGAAPTSTATANRKDVFTFFFDGTTYLGVPFGFNFASTA